MQEKTLIVQNAGLSCMTDRNDQIDDNASDCSICRWGADGGRDTIVCCYYGSEPTSYEGNCTVFEENYEDDPERLD